MAEAWDIQEWSGFLVGKTELAVIKAETLSFQRSKYLRRSVTTGS